MDHSEYLKAILSTVNVDKIKKQRYRILFDPVNGSAIEVGRQLFSRLGQLVMINNQSGQKPPRPSEPRRDSLTETAREVVKNKCAIGIATDIDADRVMFIDETGEILAEDLAAVILAQGKKKLVTPINSSSIIKDEAKQWGALVLDCRIGPPEIISTIKKHQADFASEESGKYFFCDHFLWADGLMAGAQMLDKMAQSGQSLSQIRKSYPQYFQVKKVVICPWEKMPKKIGDGVKFEFPDGSWLFIRVSGTEPLIRIFSDSQSQTRAEELARKGIELVNDILKA
jgi:phosphomannomutase/phosphoglucomutase